MKFPLPFRRKKEVPDFTMEDLRGVNVKLSADIPEGYREVEHYWLEMPFAAAQILTDGKGYFYALLEPDLTNKEAEFLQDLKERVLERVPLHASEDDRETLFEAFKEVILTELPTKHEPKRKREHEPEQGLKLELELETIAKMWYYLERDCIYAGRITPLLKDRFIEDISCSGYNKPVFVYHSLYESIPTNIVMSNEELDDFVLAVAQRRGIEISMANPIADTTLYDGSRVQLTFRSEVTDHGSTFTVRKVRKTPVTPVDLVRWNSFSAEELALLWLCLESNGSMLFVGGTAAGKTTAMNATALFIPYHSKVVSIEDTREVLLPHKNWIPSVATDRIDMFALLKAALRQRPEYIIVGEVRGKEVEIMFQAMALGHTCLSTVHGSSAEAVINRLMSPPYSVPRAMILNLDLVVVVGSFRRGDRAFRRCSGIWMVGEEAGAGSVAGEGVKLTPLFRWDGPRDLHRKLDLSGILHRISERTGRSWEELVKDLERRTRLIRRLAEEGADYRRFFERIHLGRAAESAGVVGVESTSESAEPGESITELSVEAAELAGAEGLAGAESAKSAEIAEGVGSEESLQGLSVDDLEGLEGMVGAEGDREEGQEEAGEGEVWEGKEGEVREGEVVGTEEEGTRVTEAEVGEEVEVADVGAEVGTEVVVGEGAEIGEVGTEVVVGKAEIGSEVGTEEVGTEAETEGEVEVKEEETAGVREVGVAEGESEAVACREVEEGVVGEEEEMEEEKVEGAEVSEETGREEIGEDRMREEEREEEKKKEEEWMETLRAVELELMEEEESVVSAVQQEAVDRAGGAGRAGGVENEAAGTGSEGGAEIGGIEEAGTAGSVDAETEEAVEVTETGEAVEAGERGEGESERSEAGSGVRKWTDEEIQKLIELYTQEKPLREIAELLNRSYSAVKTKIRDMKKEGVIEGRKRKGGEGDNLSEDRAESEGQDVPSVGQEESEEQERQEGLGEERW